LTNPVKHLIFTHTSGVQLRATLLARGDQPMNMKDVLNILQAIALCANIAQAALDVIGKARTMWQENKQLHG